MKYKVTRQYARGSDTPFAVFNDIIDARLFIEKKLSDDAAQKITVIYRILELGEICEEFDPSKLDTPREEQSSQGASSTASFRPSPFNTAPRPTGSPQKWLKDEEEKNK